MKAVKRKKPLVVVPLLPPGPAGRLVPLTAEVLFHPYPPDSPRCPYTWQELGLLGFNVTEARELTSKAGWRQRVLGRRVTEEQVRQYRHVRERNRARRDGNDRATEEDIRSRQTGELQVACGVCGSEAVHLGRCRSWKDEKCAGWDIEVECELGCKRTVIRVGGGKGAVAVEVLSLPPHRKAGFAED